MPIHKWVRDLVSKYSFVKKVNFKYGIFYIFYEHNGRLKHKKLPFRANRDKLIKTIESIKKEIGFEKTKKIVKKENTDKGFLFTN